VAELVLWEREDVVAQYAACEGLQRPEEVVLSLLELDLPRLAMLDIGVGAGRTTPHFASRAAHYVAIDVSETMIRACRARFERRFPSSRFSVGDARAMSTFSSGTFDFVLFSYNGLDYVTPSDRADALTEIRRVLRPGGHFLFSTHNLNADVERAFAIAPGTSLNIAGRQTLRHLCFFLLNPLYRRSRTRAQTMVINDGAHRFGCRTVYTRPGEQLRQLAAAGFGEVAVLARDGTRVPGDRLAAAGDPWLHYWCRAR
jgi:SAM-dependent methyltransferase